MWKTAKKQNSFDNSRTLLPWRQLIFLDNLSVLFLYSLNAFLYIYELTVDYWES